MAKHDADGEVPVEPGRVKLVMTNMDTGHVEERILGTRDYAILYGPGWKKIEEYRVPLIGDIAIRLREVR